LLRDSWLSIVETATYLSVSESTVKRMLTVKKNPDLITKRIGARIRILKSSIDRAEQIWTK